ncbi:sigma-70 family RNA polymerase sigma factor [Echinicola strongylocentroti]|uniref:Sigma-70 family RNA polymerase sigma factor n=1 Tax=Echinicola strongylocentroti TaxID=1795355 RepID=A0A2Z4IKE2_9BACT|nr:sigma-70 family RNA polymerase sigma factor [Echinicola strongylocentroti]AWW31160.1 sigma-70 family RNA polymerase sigma factor [Echinicola strongylocentroti]
MKKLLKTRKGREEFFLKMYYESFPAVSRYVSKRGGSVEDAKDVFQDSLMIYYEQLVAGKEVHEKRGYLFGVARHLWYSRFREASTLALGQDQTVLSQVADSGQVNTDEPLPLLGFLQSAGEKCMEMLKSFYYDRLSMDELAQRYGYRTTRSATVQKYKCLEKVRDQVKEKSLTYEDFTA